MLKSTQTKKRQCTVCTVCTVLDLTQCIQLIESAKQYIKKIIYAPYQQSVIQ